MDSILTYIITTILGLWLGSLEYRLKKHNEQIAEKPSRKEVNVITDYRLEALKASDGDLRDDIKRLEQKVDKLIDLELNRK